MNQRASGILLHPTSLPGRFGIGDLGPTAHRFLEWLEEAGQALWQMLPLGPVGSGDSPYLATSSFAGNPLLISLETLAAEGFLPEAEALEGWTASNEAIDFAAVGERKVRLLRGSWEYVLARGGADRLAEFESFERASGERPWLADWALFAAVDGELGRQSWVEWPEGLRRREPQALAAARESLREEIRFQAYLQFLFERQWRALKRRAGELGIGVVGDLPIYVAHHSADSWANQELFELDAEGLPLAVAGVPPDDFSDDGQLWGSPLYRWDRLRARGFDWWVERIGAALGRVDRLRLDHFRAFAGYWRVPASAETAADGEWRPGPGAELFAAVERELGRLPLIAEDLGVITRDVVELRRRLEVPGMKVLQFGFGEVDSDHLPHHHEKDTVVYTGTHDNDTSAGWFDSLPAEPRQRVLDYLGCQGEDVPWNLIRAAMNSVAGTSIIPLQDVFGLGSEARINTPGVAHGNWGWRLDPRLLDSDAAGRLRRLSVLAGRAPDTVLEP